MESVSDLIREEEAAKASLMQAEQRRKQAEEQHRIDLSDFLSECEGKAESFRNQAAKAADSAEKRLLYQYADDSDEQANEIRKELGLVSDNEISDQKAEREKALTNLVKKNLFGIAWKAALALCVYVLSDYTGGKLELGFMCYALKLLAKISFIIAEFLGVYWLVGQVLFGFTGTYFGRTFRADFDSLSPKNRIVLLFGILSTAFLIAQSVLQNGR